MPRAPPFVAALCLLAGAEPVPRHERVAAAQKVQEMYKHAFDSYMSLAFPADELRPLTCDGRTQRERGDLDAMLGNYSMTLIDALDSLIIFKRKAIFKVAVSHIQDSVHFNKDLEVSTFEVNIRILGGLLSGHQHAVKLLPKYKGGLLTKALDLGERLLRAFDTPTGMPRSRVNLHSGIPKGSGATVTIAEAGSFILEFGMLSVLSGDGKFYQTAKRSLRAFWSRRNALDLVGTTIDVNTGNFVDQQSTTGPGQDSFFEYLLKGYILFKDLELLDIFLSAYAAVEQHHSFEGFTYTVDMNKGLMMNTHLSPLACVWASLQVLIGDVSSGLRSVLYWYSLWKKHDALPEVYDTRSQSPTQARDSPLRPELIEAIFYLSLALPGDAAVFEMARSMADAIDEQSRVSCGFAAVADVTTKRLDNRMDSFFLSETLVYLYLAMAPSDELASALPWPLGSSVFTTEGHIFPLHGPGHEGNTGLEASLAAWDRTLPLLGAEAPIATCEALSPFERVAVQQRCRTKYLLTPSYQLQMVAETTRRCRPQEVSLLVWTEGLPPLRLHALASSLGRAVAALPLLHHRLLEEGKAAPRPDLGAGEETEQNSSCGVDSLAGLDSPERKKTPPSAWPQSLSLLRLDLEQSPGRMPSFSSALRLEPLRRLFATRFLQAADPLSACNDLLPEPGRTLQETYGGRLVIISRGGCLFVQKLLRAQQAGAAGIIMMNSETYDQRLQVMTCPNQERGGGAEVRVPAAMISWSDGQLLLQRLRQGPLAGTLFTQH
ncbi:unnamed protein product [Durusdinium trenchii]|uniref:alpha-1,2-Mannosidase n=1 Tax=Durusdinium trenchii TaxID=1381693 RepID=A0ABP0JH19_9DINO